MRNFTTILFIATLWCSPSFGQEDTAQNADTKSKLISELVEAESRLNEQLATKITELQDKYRKQLKRIRTTAKAKLTELQKSVAAEDLDLAVSIRDEIKRIDALKIDPPENEVVGKQPEKTSSQSKELARLKKIVEKQSENIGTLEKRLQSKGLSARKISGRTYAITFGTNERTWTFKENGTLLNNGKPTQTYWSAFGNDGIVCAGSDNGHIDICLFSNGGKDVEVIFVGDFKKPGVIHRGHLQSAR